MAYDCHTLSYHKLIFNIENNTLNHTFYIYTSSKSNCDNARENKLRL